MQQTSTEAQTQSVHYHTGHWKMEVLRGGVSVALGILLLFLTSFTLDLLNRIVSIYLIVDGFADIYRVATGRRETKRKLPSYLFGIISIVLGAFGLLFPLTPLFLIAIIITVRVLIRGVRVIIDARQSRRKYEGLAWLLGIFFILFAIILLLTTSFQFFNYFTSGLIVNYFTIGSILLFFCLYTLIDGLYLLIRGFLLHFRPSFFVASQAKVPESLLDLPKSFPTTTRRAMIFVRHSGANGLGHVGWAFEWSNGWFNTGAVENENSKPVATPPEMGFWSAHTLDPIATVQKHYKPYDEYKIFYVTHPHAKDAWKTVIWESRQPYTLVHQNCSDVVYDILRAYGVTDLLDPVEAPVPNDWYDTSPGRDYSIKDNPTIPIHLYKLSTRELTTQEMVLTIPSHVKDAPPSWRVNGWRTWQEMNFVLDKMLSDMQTLFVSIRHLVAKARATGKRG